MNFSNIYIVFSINYAIFYKDYYDEILFSRYSFKSIFRKLFMII